MNKRIQNKNKQEAAEQLKQPRQVAAGHNNTPLTPWEYREWLENGTCWGAAAGGIN